MKYNRKDDECHKYLVPDDLLNEFDSQMDAMADAEEMSDGWYYLCDKFEVTFGKYRI